MERFYQTGDSGQAMNHTPVNRLKYLASGYTPAKRRFEKVCITLWTLFFISLGMRLFFSFADHFPSATPTWQMLGLGFFAFLLADFSSGLVHWAADTWGTVEWPLVGNSLIRSFREHHIDPKAITRHDWIETNGDNCLAALPILAAPHLIGTGTVVSFWFSFFCFFLALFGTPTSQIHKWSHEDQVPKWVYLLQKLRIILPAHKHQIHHRKPFDHSYCITHGWLNAPLQALNFWRFAEAAIAKATGRTPREDDLGLKSHIKN